MRKRITWSYQSLSLFRPPLGLAGVGALGAIGGSNLFCSHAIAAIAGSAMANPVRKLPLVWETKPVASGPTAPPKPPAANTTPEGPWALS